MNINRWSNDKIINTFFKDGLLIKSVAISFIEKLLIHFGAKSAKKNKV